METLKMSTNNANASVSKRGRKPSEIGTVVQRTNGQYQRKTENGWVTISREEANKVGVTPKEIMVEIAEKQPVIAKAHQLTVEQRWKSYEDFITAIAHGAGKGLIAYGTGGLGKTYTMLQVLAKNGLVEFDDDNPEHYIGSEAYHYIKITGKSNTTELWKILYKHNGKLILFDDCDGFLDVEDSVNILKGAMDSTGDGRITYRAIQDKETQEFVPSRFKFTGQVAFISNRSAQDFTTGRNGKPGPLQPLASRSFPTDLTMTIDETIQRAKGIMLNNDIDFQPSDIKGKPLSVTMSEKRDVLDFIELNKNEIDVNAMNMRTITSILKMVRACRSAKHSWHNVAAQLLGLSEYDVPENQDVY